MWFFFFLNILKTKCDSVQERAFFAILHTGTLGLQKNLTFKRKKFTLLKKILIEQLEIFHQRMHTYFRNK